MSEACAATYRVRVLPAAHELEVEAEFEAPSGARLWQLRLPTWVLGAYAFMRYARDLFDLCAEDATTGRPLEVTREGWSGFRVEGKQKKLRVRYRVSRSDWSWAELVGFVEDDHAVLLGTHCLFAERATGPCEVEYLLPASWHLHAPASAERLAPQRLRFRDYAALLDSPVVVGRFDVRTVQLGGVDFHHVHLDRGAGFEQNVGTFTSELMAVAEECRKVFGSFPFEHYTFICSASPTAHWGLEHASSTMIGLGRHVFIDPVARGRAVRLAAHELFHAWNVCRLRPAGLGELDLLQGSFTDGLWVSEGFTRYYEFLLAARAGVLPPVELVSNLVNYYRHLEVMPAYRRVTAVDSSRATFLNHNKYPGSINNSVDYYDLGMLIAFDLDVFLRTAPKPSSLDAEFRAFYEAFAGKGSGFTSVDLERFLDERCPGAGELVRREALGAGGLQVPASFERLGFEVVPRSVPFAGLVLKENAGPEVVNVLEGSAAAAAGMAAGDLLVEAGGLGFDLKTLRWCIEHEPSVELLFQRGASLRRCRLVPGRRTELGALRWRGSAADRARLKAWVGGGELTLAEGAEVPLLAYDNFHGIQTVL